MLSKTIRNDKDQLTGSTHISIGIAKKVPSIIPNCKDKPPRIPAYFLYCSGTISNERIKEVSIIKFNYYLS